IIRMRATALEKLGKTKEAIPILETLVRKDKKSPEIALKLADASLNSDLDKAVEFYKQAMEGFAKTFAFEKLKTVWTKFIELVPDDFSFFKKIERILSGHRQKDIVADLYNIVATYYVKNDDVDNIIKLSKKILEYNPNLIKYRNELVRAYREKYKEHSLLEEFLKFSGLLTKKTVSTAIQSFETNIVFDKGNYVFHRTWGVGKINELTTDEMIIDFKTKPGHKMDIQMALKSLKPLKEDHFWVQVSENEEKMKEMFEKDLKGFFVILIKSFGGSMTLGDIKAELSDKFVPLKVWSKWWTKHRPIVVDNREIIPSATKKDLLEYHESPIAGAEKLIEKFLQAQSYEEKLDMLLTTINKSTTSKADGENERTTAAEEMTIFFKDSLKSVDFHTRLLSLLALGLADQRLSGFDLKTEVTEDVKKEIATTFSSYTPVQAAAFGANIKSHDLREYYASWIKENHPKWENVLIEMLFETPLRNQPHYWSMLLENPNETLIKTFYNRLVKDAKSNIELYIWTLKQRLMDDSDQPAGISIIEHILGFFRLLRSIQKSELKGTKLKNAARDLIIGARSELLGQVIAEQGKDYARKFAALLVDISFLTDTEKEQFTDKLKSLFPEAFQSDEDDEPDEEKDALDLVAELEREGITAVSKTAMERMKVELDHLVSTEIPANSEEIGIAQERGDLRENSEYKAALERQQILQASVTRIENDLKHLMLLTLDKIPSGVISLGTRVRLKDADTGDMFVYSIMDKWDADVDHGIIAYKSPLGRSLLNHRKGQVVNFTVGDKTQKLEILSIEPAVNTEGYLI
ncbi:MAG: GreA/GreB family elongation factor, partial [Leptospiraceae bacterium]|nr:GreA/GreB family elongation factor [Leptospiraceae bacterium]